MLGSGLKGGFPQKIVQHARCTYPHEGHATRALGSTPRDATTPGVIHSLLHG